jgi:hypothetical protein
MSGTEEDRLADAREYLRGSRIVWRRLAGTAIGSLILAWATGFVDLVTAYFAGISRVVGGTLGYYRDALTALFRIPIAGFDAGFAAARADLLGLELGPLAFVAGVAFVIGWFWLLSAAAERLEVI